MIRPGLLGAASIGIRNSVGQRKPTVSLADAAIHRRLCSCIPSFFFMLGLVSGQKRYSPACGQEERGSPTCGMNRGYTKVLGIEQGPGDAPAGRFNI